MLATPLLWAKAGRVTQLSTKDGMRPIFTVHAGEFLVGEYIEQQYRSLDAWIPTKDSGIDLLVTDTGARRAISLQVKFSRDYLSPVATETFHSLLLTAGWLNFDHGKIENSPAQWWVIVLVSHERKAKPQFIVIPPAELLSRLVQIHGKTKRYQFYPWVTKTGLCLEGRGLNKEERAQLADGTLDLGARDLSQYLNKWPCLDDLQK